MDRRVTEPRVGLIATLALLVFAAACSVSESTSPLPLPPLTAKISPNIDLDQPDLLLQYKNTNGVIQDVIPPWGSGASTTAPDNIRFDHFTPDGWVVVYNTFDVEQTNARPVLMLYNKYRGTLRWWWWNDQDPAGPSNYLTYGLMIDGANTSALNFVGEFPKAYSVQNSHPFVVKTNSASFNQGLLNGAWYYFDTEFAYDPNVAGQPQTTYSLALNAWATSDSKIKLSGDINGTMNGTINGAGKGVNLFGNFLGSITSTSYESAFMMIDNGPKAKDSFWDKLNSAVSSGLTNAVKNSLSQLATQGLNILGSPLENLFGSILSSSPTPQQKIELKLAANINVSGDVTTDQPAFWFKGALPGTARGDPAGYLPYYNETLGLFNLASPPVVKWRQITGLQPPPGPGQKDIQFMLPAVPSIVVNPAIAGEVTVSPVTATLFYIKSYSGKEALNNPNYLSINNFSNWVVVNNLYGNVWYAFSAPYAIRYDWWTGSPDEHVVVRLKFTITPNNGSPPVEVVKIYRPTIVPF